MKRPMEYNWDVLGAILANGSESEQAEFFAGFVNEMKSWDSHYQAQLQLSHVHGKLKPKDREAIGELFPSLWETE